MYWLNLIFVVCTLVAGILFGYGFRSRQAWNDGWKHGYNTGFLHGKDYSFLEDTHEGAPLFGRNGRSFSN